MPETSPKPTQPRPNPVFYTGYSAQYCMAEVDPLDSLWFSCYTNVVLRKVEALRSSDQDVMLRLMSVFLSRKWKQRVPHTGLKRCEEPPGCYCWCQGLLLWSSAWITAHCWVFHLFRQIGHRAVIKGTSRVWNVTLVCRPSEFNSRMCLCLSSFCQTSLEC